MRLTIGCTNRFIIEKLPAVCGVILFATLTCRAISEGHDLHQAVFPVAKIANTQSVNAEIAKTPVEGNTRDALQSIVLRLFVWNNPHVTVCFGPSNAVDARLNLVQRIIPVARQWTDGANLTLDFGIPAPRKCTDSSTANIRVNIADPGQNPPYFASLIGNDAAYSSIQGYAPYSMALLFPEDSPLTKNEDMFRFYVLHEFGHALGAQHEHQRVDCQYDYNYIASNFGFASAQAAKNNMDKMFAYPESAYPGIRVTSTTVESPYDNYSIMKYNMATTQTFPDDDPRVYLQGKNSQCYRKGWVNNLTKFDHDGIIAAYSNPNIATAATLALVSGGGTAGASPGQQFLTDPPLGRAAIKEFSEYKLAPDPKNVKMLGNSAAEFQIIQKSPAALTGLKNALRLLDERLRILKSQ